MYGFVRDAAWISLGFVHPCRESRDRKVFARQADLHLLLKVVTQHTVQLLHIMLHEAFHGVPSKRLGQVFCGDAGIPKLQLQQYSTVCDRPRIDKMGSFAVCLSG